MAISSVDEPSIQMNGQSIRLLCVREIKDQFTETISINLIRVGKWIFHRSVNMPNAVNFPMKILDNWKCFDSYCVWHINDVEQTATRFGVNENDFLEKSKQFNQNIGFYNCDCPCALISILQNVDKILVFGTNQHNKRHIWVTETTKIIQMQFINTEIGHQNDETRWYVSLNCLNALRRMLFLGSFSLIIISFQLVLNWSLFSRCNRCVIC